MPDIYHDFQIMAPIDKVFATIISADGMSQWWTLDSSGSPEKGNMYELNFGPGYEWKGEVTDFVAGRSFELTLVEANEDWVGSRVRFDLEDQDYCTSVSFRHSGWAALSDHYRISCFCWAMYLRILKRFIEHGEKVPYEKRLSV